MSSAWLSCKPVESDLRRVADMLVKAVKGDEELTELASHLLALRGKRLRPALLLLARGGMRADLPALKASAAIELIHLASLYHDDIMDRSLARRGSESVNAKWGNGVAALGGTFLFARAQHLMLEVGANAAELASAASAQLCAGQLREAENAYNLDLSLEEHLEILRLKTATLFILAVDLGSLLAGAPPSRTKALRCYAAALGLAFQLHDDLLDWTGDESVMGKDLGVDLRSGVYGLPILETLSATGAPDQSLRRILAKHSLSQEDIAEVRVLVADHGLKHLRRQAAAESDRAIEAVAALEPGPVRKSLEALARFAVARPL